MIHTIKYFNQMRFWELAMVVLLLIGLLVYKVIREAIMILAFLGKELSKVINNIEKDKGVKQ